MGIRIYSRGMSIANLHLTKTPPVPEKIEVPFEYVKPSWVSEGHLGDFMNETEVDIQLDYNDPSNVASEFVLIGALPNGLLLNTVIGRISGYMNDTTTKTYTFSISMKTPYGDITNRTFTIGSIVTESIIVWDTDSNMGIYNTGDNVNHPISAHSAEVIA